MQTNQTIIPMLAIGTTIFFTSQWEEWHSRTCKHAIMGVIGVTETQLATVGMILIAGFGMPLHNLTMGDIFGKDGAVASVMPGCPDGTIFAESHFISWINILSACGPIIGIPI